MSKFFEALEQADRDRERRQQTDRVPVRNPVPTGEPAEERPAVERPEVAGVGTAAMPRRDGDRDGTLRNARHQADPDGLDEHLVSLLQPASFAAEQFIALRHVIDEWRQPGERNVLGISSAAVGDGKTTTAINLAGALAQSPGARVLLIEADLRRPSVSHYLALEDNGQAGLAQAIGEPRLTFDQVARVFTPFNLTVVPAGPAPAASYELLKSPRLEEFLKEARGQFDYVIVDTPPVLPAPDCRILGRALDAFLLVVGASRTPRRLVAEAVDALNGHQVLGIVFNGDDEAATRYRRSYRRGRHDHNGSDRPYPWTTLLRGSGRSGDTAAMSR